MGRPKKDNMPVDVDALLAETLNIIEAKFERKGVPISKDDFVHVLPMPSLILRYLIQNDGWPLGRIYQIVGPPGSYKSTFAAELFRWHKLCGGGCVRVETECKDNPELIYSLLDWDRRHITTIEATSIEEWQGKLTAFIKELKRKMGASTGPGRTIPWLFILDSVNGATCETVVDNIQTTGFASPGFPIDAQLIARFLRSYHRLTASWPFNFAMVNHLKVLQDPRTMKTEYYMPGGNILGFFSSIILELNRAGKIHDYENYRMAEVVMKCIKNGYGANNIRITVPFRTWMQDDGNGIFRLHSRFEWHTATIKFLGQGYGIDSRDAERIIKKVRPICDINSVAAGSKGTLWWSSRLDVPQSDPVPADVLGNILESRVDVLEELYPVLGIQRRRFFKPGIDYLRQYEEYAHLVQQADASDDWYRRAAELQPTITSGIPLDAIDAAHDDSEIDDGAE